MKQILNNLRSPTIISFCIVLPFMILEFMFVIFKRLDTFSLRNTLDFIVVFGFLWLGIAAIILILMPIVQKLRTGANLFAHPMNLLLAVAVLILVTTIVGGVIVDQYPCWIGTPNCD